MSLTASRSFPSTRSPRSAPTACPAPAGSAPGGRPAGTAPMRRSCCCSTPAPASLASLIAADRSSTTRPTPASRQNPGLFTLIAFLFLPPVLAARPLGPRRLRPPLPRPRHRRVQAGRPRLVDGRGHRRPSLAFATKTELSRLSVGAALRRRPGCSSWSCATSPGGCCTDPPDAAGLARRTGCCWSAPCRRRSRSTRRSPAARPPASSRSASTSPRATRRAAASTTPVPVYAGRDVLVPGPRARRRHDRGLRLGQRRAGRAAPAGLAAGGHRRRPGRRAAAHRHRRPPRAHPADRGPAAAATSRSRRSPASRWLVKNLIDRVVAAARPAARCCRSSPSSRSPSGSPTPARSSSASPGSAARAGRSGSGSSGPCTSTPRSAWPPSTTRTRATACCSRSRTTRGSSRSAGSCGPPRSTSCRS